MILIFIFVLSSKFIGFLHRFIGVTVLYFFELMLNHLIVFLKLIICDIEAVIDVIEKNFVISLSLMYYSNPY